TALCCFDLVAGRQIILVIVMHVIVARAVEVAVAAAAVIPLIVVIAHRAIIAIVVAVVVAGMIVDDNRRAGFRNHRAAGRSTVISGVVRVGSVITPWRWFRHASRNGQRERTENNA